MKNTKKIIGFLVAIILIAGCFFTLFPNNVKAAYYQPSEKIKVPTSSPYEFNAQEYLELARNRASSTTDDTVFANRLDLTGKTAILIHQYDDNFELMTGNDFGDERITVVEATRVLCFAFGIDSPTDMLGTLESRSATWYGHVKHLICSIADAEEGIEKEDVKVTVTVTTPRIVIDDLTIERKQYEISSDTMITEEVMAGIEQARLDNIAVYEKMTGNTYEYGHGSAGAEVVPQQIVTVAATTTKNNAKYRMAIANDDNWYMIKEVEPDSNEEDAEFKTELTYSAMVGTIDVGYTMDKGTCLPKYDKNNVKKDADVTAIIKSKNDLEILTVDGKTIGADKTTPNEDGWYYTTAGSKKEIAKLYKFADYDNLDANGTVVYDETQTTNNYRGKVKVTLGSIEVDGEQLESEEQISIQWPFRVIEDVQDPTEIKEDTTKVTRTVTTNLPIDKNKLPDGWKFTDTELGKTQHQIYKVYTRENGDVTETPVIKKNGGNDTVTVDVKVTWPDYSGKKNDEPTVLPQTGAFTAIIVIAIVGISGYAITRYKKLKK